MAGVSHPTDPIRRKAVTFPGRGQRDVLRLLSPMGRRG